MSYYGYRDADPYYADDVDRVEEVVLREDYRRARKEHRCGYCNRAIPKGAVYQSQFGVSEGDIFYGKKCASCLDEERCK